jgi:predicted ATP-grasp superfamily ATP-dependent carboligase
MTNLRTETNRVLVIGDDMRIFLALVRSLGRAGKEVHAAPFDWRAPALTSRYVARVHHLPRYQHDPAGWLDLVARLADAYRFDLILPCCDRAILPLSLNRDALAGHRIALPPAGAMDVLFDKAATRGLAAELGVPVAPGEVLTAGRTAAELVARYGLPLVVKPRRSFSLDKLDTWGRVHIVEDAASLDRLLAEIAVPEEMLVEGFFKNGEGVGVSVLAERGEVRLAFQHRRLREGWGGSSSYRASEPLDPEMLAACRGLARRVGLHGVCMFEFRRGADGRFILIETNARFWGSCPLPVSLGVDFPAALYDLLMHERAPAQPAYPAGVRSRNLVLDGANLLRTLRSPRAIGFAARLAALGGFLLQPAGWLTGAERSDSFVADDPAPGFAEIARLLARRGEAFAGAERRRAPVARTAGGAAA